MESLPGEIVIEIFNYLNLREKFHGFWNLNFRLNQLLIHSQYHLSLKNDDQNSEHILRNLLPILLNPQLVLHLRLENLKKVDLSPCSHFSNLISLKLCKFYMTDSILDLIRSFSPSLQYLNFSSFISNKWNEIVPLILSLPKLHTCYLHLGIALCSISSSSLVSVSLKHLYLVNSRQSFALSKLSSLLNRLPNLNSLHVRCHRLQFTGNLSMHPNMQSSIVNFTLITDSLPEFFADFMFAIFSLMPHLKQLEVQSIEPVSNLVYLNIYQWQKMLDLFIHLEKLILILHPKSTIKKSHWTKRCERLHTLTNIRQIDIQIQDP